MNIKLIIRESVSFVIYLFILLFSRKRKGTVILLYHSIADIRPRDDSCRINILPERFRRHLEVISKYKNKGKKIKITFDDGYGNIFKNAFPLLKEYNLEATVFLVTDFIDGKINSEDFTRSYFREKPLTWEEIQIMDRQGISFGSHSKTHTFLTKISQDELEEEILFSKSRIEEALGRQINSFAYPFGGRDSFSEATRKSLIDAGYSYAYINLMGENLEGRSDELALKRIRVYTEDGSFRLKMKISGAYDWIDRWMRRN